MKAMNLDPAALRVLGSLMEKEMTTPELYSLSVNSLIAAANQKSSREPVMELTEDQVRGALDVLDAHELISVSRDSRVPKYEHRIRTTLGLRRDETALICLLLLRGSQTPGELRGRAERMYVFEDLSSVQAALDRLAQRETPLVRPLPKAPGSREGRTIHLLGGHPGISTEDDNSVTLIPLPDLSTQLLGRIADLELRVGRLEENLKAGRTSEQQT